MQISFNTGREFEIRLGDTFTSADVGVGGPASTIAVVVANPNDPSVLGLMNSSASTWNAIVPGVGVRQISPGQNLKLAEGLSIDFGMVQGSIVSSMPVQVSQPYVAPQYVAPQPVNQGNYVPNNYNGYSQEDRMFSVAACMTAHMCVGIIPLGIFLLKKKDSKFIAFYGAMGSLAGGLMILALLLLMVYMAVSFGSLATTGILSWILAIFGCVSYLLALLAMPAMLIVMIVSAVSAWNGKIVEIPFLTNMAKRISGF